MRELVVLLLGVIAIELLVLILMAYSAMRTADLKEWARNNQR